MQKLRDIFESRRNLCLSAVGFVAVAAPLVFGLAIAMPSDAHAQLQTQTQNTTATALPKFEYEVASIKLDQSDHTSAMTNNPPDGFTATNATLKGLIQNAYGVLNYQISGGPDWLSSERYVIDAKMDAATADALQKLSREDRVLARQQMLQALLADRLKLTIHRETRELPVYFLVVAKNGHKVQQSKPGDTYSSGIKGRGGVPGGPGMLTSSSSRLSSTMTAQGMPISSLTPFLAGPLGRPVLDKTGLTGNFDFTLKFAVDRAQAAPGDSPNGLPPSPSADSDIPFLFEAIQQQLGLKLESGKGPVEVIVIDHIERPSGN